MPLVVLWMQDQLFELSREKRTIITYCIRGVSPHDNTNVLHITGVAHMMQEYLNQKQSNATFHFGRTKAFLDCANTNLQESLS